MEDKSSSDNCTKMKKSRISHDQVDWDIMHKRLEVSIDIFDALNMDTGWQMLLMEW